MAAERVSEEMALALKSAASRSTEICAECSIATGQTLHTVSASPDKIIPEA